MHIGNIEQNSILRTVFSLCTEKTLIPNRVQNIIDKKL